MCISGKPRRWLGLCTDFSLRLAAHVWPGEIRGTWPDAVIDRVIHAEEQVGRPVFSGYYIYDPIGHTPHSHSYRNEESLAAYKRHFAEAVKRAHEFLRRIEQLRKRFPDSIFIISGDHGPWLTRDAEREEAGARFWILDTYGVALALLNASNLCPQPRRWLAQQRYLTPARMLAAALACDGQSERLTEGFEDKEDFVRFSDAPLCWPRSPGFCAGRGTLRPSPRQASAGAHAAALSGAAAGARSREGRALPWGAPRYRA